MKKIIIAVAVAVLFCTAAYAQESVKKLGGKTLAEWKTVATDATKSVAERLRADVITVKLVGWKDLKLAKERLANVSAISDDRAAHRALSLRISIGAIHARAGRRAETLAAFEALVGQVENLSAKGMSKVGVGWAANVCRWTGCKWREPKLTALAVRFYKVIRKPSNLHNPAIFLPRFRSAAFSAAQRLDILTVWKPLYLNSVEDYGFDVGKIKILAEMCKCGVITQAEERGAVKKYAEYLATQLDSKNADKAKVALRKVLEVMEVWKRIDDYTKTEAVK